MGKIRIILIVAVLAIMGGIGYTQYATLGAAGTAMDAAGDDHAALDAYEPEEKVSTASSGNKAGNLIKSTKTSSRVGGDKTITIQRKSPSLWTRIRMWFGYQPEDPYRRDMARLKAEPPPRPPAPPPAAPPAEARHNTGVNNVTGRKESTASVSSAPSGASRKAAPNKTVASALGN